MSIILQSFLKPLIPFLRTPHLREISVLCEHQIALDIKGIGYVFKEAKELDLIYWRTLCHLLANMNGLMFHPESHPILSTSLYDSETEKTHRFEAMLGSCVERGISISIRIHQNQPKTFDDFGLEGELKQMLINSILLKKSIMISGGTSSGKTTLLNLLGAQIPLTQRILSLEDSREIMLPHKNWKAYCVPRHTLKTSVTYHAMIDHFMRSRPDVILAGEISVLNSFPILRLLNTGHQSFMCTIHANSALLAIEEAFQHNLSLAGYSINGISAYLKKAFDLVIHLHSTQGDQKKIQEILDLKENKILYTSFS